MTENVSKEDPSMKNAAHFYKIDDEMETICPVVVSWNYPEAILRGELKDAKALAKSLV